MSSSTSPNQFEQFHKYRWHEDAEFNSGLQQIGSLGTDPDIILKAKQFFFNKKHGINIDILEYKQWLKTRSEGSGTVNEADNSDTSSGPSLSYDQIVELILSGKPVPGIKQIPNTILGTEASSDSKVAPRKKPWE